MFAHRNGRTKNVSTGRRQRLTRHPALHQIESSSRTAWIFNRSFKESDLELSRNSSRKIQAIVRGSRGLKLLDTFEEFLAPNGRQFALTARA